MKKFFVFPQLFAGGHTVTVTKDEHMTTASASSTSDVQADATVTLTLTPASGYEVADVEVLAGGVTIHEDSDVVTFKMGSSDVAIMVRSQKNNEYIVLENRDVWVNGSKTALKRNAKLLIAENGMVYGNEGTPSALTISADVIASLKKEGVIIKANPAWEGEPTPSA